MKNQILHIFRKDVQHHWPEIVLSLLAITAYTWRECDRLNALNRWPSAYDVFSNFLSALVVLSWGLLIVRVVHEENLVGDRQFWVTRPYEWKKLLAAKLLAILAFVNIPLFSVQSFLLLSAGFSPGSHFAGLLWSQLLWIVFVILPIVTLATVTATNGQFILAVLAVFLYFIVIASITSRIPGLEVIGASALPGWLAFLILLGTGFIVIVWQYSRRIAAGCRVFLLAAILLATILFAVTPYRAIISQLYPQAPPGQQVPVVLAFDTAKPASRGRGFPEKHKVHVTIPLLASGIAEDTEVIAGGRIVHIQAPGGLEWSSGWQASGEFFLPNIHHDQTTLTIDDDFFERVKSSTVDVHITYALAPRHARQTTRIVAQAAGFFVPDEGRCSFSPFAFDRYAISCVFPLKSPSQLMSTTSEEISCAGGNNETPLPAGTTLYGGGGWYAGTGPADFGISPIRIVALFFWSSVETTDPNYRPHVCPGTPITFRTDWQDLQRLRMDLDINDIRLADYQLNDSYGGDGGFAIGVPHF